LQAGELEAKGHHLKAVAGGFGNMQAILWDRNAQRVHAASDPRGLGVAEVR
jgi:gamma-glutamyltranspeptidase/glutathione hydrolase